MALRTPVEMVDDGAAATPDLDVLTFVETLPVGLGEEVRTFAQLRHAGRAMAAALVGEGMGEGDTFALIMRNHPEFVEAMLGSELAGTVFVPIDPRTRGDKLVYMLGFAECRGAFVADYALAHLMAVLRDLPHLEWVWVLGDTCTVAGPVRASTLAEVLARGDSIPPPRTPDLKAPMQLLYTSGTTGDPKAIVASYERYASVAALGGTIGLTAADRPYTGLSFSHANAQLITLGNALAMGLRLVVSRQFSKSRLWEILARYECTMFSLLGGMAIAIYAEPPGPRDRAHRVRYVLSAGMPTALWQPFAARFGVEVFEFYGLAEGGLTMNPPGHGPVGSIGKAPPGIICAVLTEDDREAAAGEIGEICFRPEGGDHPPVTYLKNTEASSAKVAGGWFRTGDAGHLDSDGWLYFAHRITSSIRRNGDFVSAAHIEAEIAAMPEVADVHVYGLATPANAPGEKEVVAAIVRQPHAVFDPRQVVQHCRDRIGSSATPTFIQLVDAIPKTASEKPQERFLAAMLADGRCELFDMAGEAVAPTAILGGM